jgi:hypothetical protein
MRKYILMVALAAAVPVDAQTIPGTGDRPPPSPSTWWSEWDGAAELSLAPAFGEGITSDGGNDLVDDSEYEASVRIWRPIDRLNGLRLQFQAGVTASPYQFDGEAPESAAYAEVEIGDTFIPLREFLRRDFRRAAPDAANAVRPYARYRLTSVHDGFLDGHARDEHKGTLGIRYRRVPLVMADDDSVPGAYWEARAELNRVWSTDDSQEVWNPKLQLDVYGRPFLGGVRFVFSATGEANVFAHALAPDGDEREEWRIRVTPGFDVSAPLQRRLGWSGIEAQILGRLEHRSSNDPERDHTRLYFVPSVTVTVPFQ